MKKILSNLTALLATATTVVSLVVSASFNYNKDPNGDGDLDYADNIYITQYLYGHHEPSDLTQLDVDDNDVVSTVDAQYVQLYCLGLLNNLSDDEKEENIIKTGDFCNYNVYNAQTGAYLRNYSLTVPDDNNSGSKGSVDNNKTENDRGIVGPTDDRIQDWSNRGAAKIMCSTSEWGAGYRGSGFVVGPHIIATAAHVVFDTTDDYAFKLSEILLFDANQTSHSFTPVEYHVPSSFINSSEYTSTNDYALITVEEDLTNYNSFILGSITDTAASNQLEVKTVGFPQCLYSNIQSNSVYDTTLINDGTNHDERLSTGNVTYTYSNIIRFNADTSPGNSGGPIYVDETLNGIDYQTVVGINVSQPYALYAPYNTGVRFNALILKFYKGNDNNIYY